MKKAGFIGYEPWEAQYFDGHTCTVKIPCGDIEAWKMYPKHNWVYNKLELCKSQGIEAYPHGIKPRNFPVFSKPITNLYGLSNGSRMLHEWNDSKDYMAGYFFMPVLEGEQLSIDFALSKGRIVWAQPMKCIKDENGHFVKFKAQPEFIPTTIRDWIKEHLNDFTGIINLEIIDDKIVDCHLRMSPQFIDLYGMGWLDLVKGLYETQGWRVNHGTPQTGISRVLRSKIDFTPKVNDANKLEELKSKVSSIQLVWYEGLRLSDEPQFSLQEKNPYYRYAIINGFDEEAVEEVASKLDKIIVPVYTPPPASCLTSCLS